MADFMKVDMSRLGQAEGRSADSGMAAPSGADVDTFQQAVRQADGRVPEERSPTGDVGLPMLLTRIPQPRPKRFPACFPG